MRHFKTFAISVFVCLTFLLAGCGTTENIDGVDVRTDFQGRGVKTFQVPVFPLYEATLEALKNMNLPLDDNIELEDKYQLTSETDKHNIIIDLEGIGPKISRITVRAQEGGFFSLSNNEAMGREIIKETALVLESKGIIE